MILKRFYVSSASSSGFTLIEMSVVLVVIGLLTGGIIAGKSLVQASRLQSVITDMQAYNSAIASFKEKYAALPGDMANATSYWGTNANCATFGAGTGTQTCNGNGNGAIANISGSEDAERFLIFQHLADAGLIPGAYTGVAGAVNVDNAIIGTNVPSSKVVGGGYSIYYLGIYSDSSTFSANYNHAMMFGAVASNGILGGGIITPLQAASLDQKIDDGLPGSGTVLGPPMSATYAPSCTTSNTAASAAYNVSSLTALCTLYFTLNF